MQNTQSLPYSFYDRPVAEVAKDLLGKRITWAREGVSFSGIITETEAYCVDDPASHAYLGKRTERNAPLFGPVGHTYVYFIYGMHHCLNIVARDTATKAAGGVLIRGVAWGDKELRLMQGPGKIGRMLGLTLQDNCIDVTQQGSLSIEVGPDISAYRVAVTPRIGISKAVDVLWRFELTW